MVLQQLYSIITESGYSIRWKLTVRKELIAQEIKHYRKLLMMNEDRTYQAVEQWYALLRQFSDV